MTRFASLGVLAALLSASPASRADDPKTGTTYAVAIGVGDFADADIKKRPTAEADAVDFFAAITDPTVGGVKAANAVLLTSNPAKNKGAVEATRAAIMKALGDVKAKANAEDTVLVFAVMQGASVGDKTGLFATDSTFGERPKTALLALDIEKELKDIKAQQISPCSTST